MQDEKKIKQFSFTTHDGSKINYNLLYPDTFNHSASYPLLIFFHGAGERGSDNCLQLTHGKNIFLSAAEYYHSFVLIPQCPLKDYWVEIDRSSEKLRLLYTPSKSLIDVMELILTFIDSNSVDLCRLYLMGISMGGFGVWSLLQMYPKVFAAAVPICGGGNPAQGDILVDTPIWAFHGTDDGVIPVTSSRQIITAIRSAGGTPIYTELSQIGHDAWTPAFNEPGLLDWLYAQKNSSPKPRKNPIS